MLAEWLLPYLAFLNKSDNATLGIAVFFLYNFNVYHIARHAERYEDNAFVVMEQALAFGCYGLYSDALKGGIGFPFSAHS